MASRPRLAILGASARAAAQSAIRAGFDVVAADLFTDLDLAAMCPATRVDRYPEGFAEWLSRANADAWIYTGGLENYPELIDQLAGMLPLWGNDGAAVRRVRDLATLHTALLHAGIPFPATRAEPTGLPLDGSWICKAGGSGGSGVWLLDSRAAADRATRQGAVYQKKLTASVGFPASAVFVLNDTPGDGLIGVTRQLVGPDFGAAPFQYAGSAGPIDLPPPVVPVLRELSRLLAGQFGLRGVVGVDLWVGADQLWVLEVNPRYTASVELHELTSGVAALSLHAAAFAKWRPAGPVPCPPSTRTSAKKQIVYARHRLTVPPDVNPGVGASMATAAEIWLADIPRAGETIEPAHPVVTVLGRLESADGERRFSNAVAAVEKRLYT
ncbi:ATP-grasp domain protein [Posidoniimonas polymericola]|uniref:ATP-grasp domain protein n=1 Tax=Posidoniimonas polymericola TaxID=2528002 RepID=A0A5C5YHW1_9BACT|nr:ATP-grasp domain-containing protein [Posidoniimonas polymericola]TWT73452.1 ATP-grasp domain protein [Posidoniimonas polymericola]